MASWAVTANRAVSSPPRDQLGVPRIVAGIGIEGLQPVSSRRATWARAFRGAQSEGMGDTRVQTYGRRKRGQLGRRLRNGRDQTGWGRQSLVVQFRCGCIRELFGLNLPPLVLGDRVQTHCRNTRPSAALAADAESSPDFQCGLSV